MNENRMFTGFVTLRADSLCQLLDNTPLASNTHSHNPATPNLTRNCPTMPPRTKYRSFKIRGLVHPPKRAGYLVLYICSYADFSATILVQQN